MKRVKKGFRMELRDGSKLVVAQEHGGKLRMTESSASTYDAVDLTAAMCEQAGILDALEDVPEPGERLYLAATEADGNASPIPWRDKSEPSKERWREKAAELGIKPMEES